MKKGLRGGEALFTSPADTTSINDGSDTKIRPSECLSAAARVRVGCAVRVALHGAVRKRDRHELAAMRPVLERMNHGLDFHTGREGLGNPTLAGETAGGAR